MLRLQSLSDSRVPVIELRLEVCSACRKRFVVARSCKVLTLALVKFLLAP